jgi:hypothetical protein
MRLGSGGARSWCVPRFAGVFSDRQMERFGALSGFLWACWCVAGACLAFAGSAAAVEAGARQIGATECHGPAFECGAAGQLDDPNSVAVNNDFLSPSFGNMYVVDRANWRVDSFAASSGVFDLAWGSGVLNGARELQTCKSSCRRGLREETPPLVTGGVSYALSVAVDSDPLSSSVGDVYVAAHGADRVEKFGSDGEFLLTFGGEVNVRKTSEFHEPGNPHGVTEAEEDVCVLGEECQAGKVGAADREFQELSSVVVGPGGLVYVGDQARVQVFEPSGVWKEAISLAALSPKAEVTSLAVDSLSDVFVAFNGAFVVNGGISGVREFQSVAGKWSESSTRFDAASTSVVSLAVDGVGDLYVGDSNGRSSFGFHILKYNVSSGKEVGDFGSNTVRGGSTDSGRGSIQQAGFQPSGMAFSEAAGVPELYVPESYGEAHTGDVAHAVYYSSVWALPVPPPGPLVEGVSVKPEPRGSASLEATINPEGNETTYHFEYVSEKEFEACKWSCSSVVKTAPAMLAAGLSGVQVNKRVSGLGLSTSYEFRVVATNVESKPGKAAEREGSFETLPAAVVEVEYATNVASTSATIGAAVNPLESATEYRLEYGMTLAYEHVVAGSAGEGTVSVSIERHLQDLSPGTTYHYRLVLRNELGMVEGADRTFTTQTVSGGSLLADGRAWELVSPANKKGALIEPTYSFGNVEQAASDGGGIAYMTVGPHVGEDPQGKTTWSTVLSTRLAPGVWGSRDLTLPGRLAEGLPAFEVSGIRPEYHGFSQDLSLAAVEPQWLGTPLLSPEATERTIYLRDNPACPVEEPERSPACYRPLVSAVNVPSEKRFGGEEGGVGYREAHELQFVSATPDFSHVLVASPFALTEGARESPNQDNLYEWSTGRLQLVNVLEDGEATHDLGTRLTFGDGGLWEGAFEVIPSALSPDGRRVVWGIGIPYEGGESTEWKLFVRDMVEEKTERVGGPHAVFQWMSSSGTSTKVFYIENGDLYVFDFTTDTTTDLTSVHGAPGSGEVNAGVQEEVSDVSGDGSYVYFVATSVLANAPRALGGADNLYVLHDTGSGWSTTFIATLSSEDAKTWRKIEPASRGGHAPDLAQIASRVSPNGRYLAFMSSRPLTGYDNTDALSGQPDEEVYLYDAAGSRLVCASCNPTGARPVGVLDTHVNDLGVLLVDRGQGTWAGGNTGSVNDHWLAGSIPDWDHDMNVTGSQYQPRYLSDDGRLFFDSPDGLVPKATNGLENVYEYEPAGVGGTAGCTVSSSTFSERSGGCVSLISSGTSSGESAFLDASESGDDVFFVTLSKLVAADYDNGYDVYDAHVCSTSAPCVPVPVSPPPCTSGDSCKAAPTPQPEIFGPAPSATFNGKGNVTPSTTTSVVPRSLTRAQKLGRALQACRKKKRRAARTVCEHQAHARYGAGRARKAGATRKGGR